MLLPLIAVMVVPAGIPVTRDGLTHDQVDVAGDDDHSAVGGGGGGQGDRGDKEATEPPAVTGWGKS